MQSMRVALSLALLSLFVSPISPAVPVTGPLETTSGLGTVGGPGGMFGYSVSMTNGTVNGTTIMAVAKPWDATVYLYSANTPQGTYNANNTPNAVGAPSWTSIGSVVDTAAPLWTTLIDAQQGGPSYSRSYFGHSVDLSADGRFMAIGVPGRYGMNMNYPNVSRPQLDWAPFNGEVRFYIMPPVGTSVTGLSFSVLTMSTAYKSKFGHQVKFSLDGNYLFVANNAGWDGLWVNLAYTNTGSTPGCKDPSYVSNPSNNMTSAGVSVYKIVGTTPQLMTTLPVVSPVPFGQSGIKIDSTGYGAKTTLMVRAYSRDSTGVSTSGGVSIYTLNAAGNFVSSANLYNRNTAAGANTNSFMTEDWFGYSMASGYDYANDRVIMAVGAPRDGSVAYAYSANGAALSTNASMAQLSSSAGWNSLVFNNTFTITNDAYVTRNFFGGNVKMSTDARFLYVADATNSNGRGQVQVYMLRNGTVGNTLALGYESVPITPVPPGYTNATVQTAPFIYDKLTTLSNNLTDYAIGQDSSLSQALFKQDSFGAAMAVNQYWTVIGAPAGDSVYTFPSLVAYPLYQPPQGNSTNSVPNISGGSSNSSKNATYIGIGTALGVALLAIPGAFYAIAKQNKKKLIARLEAQKALAELNANPWENPAAQGSVTDLGDANASSARLIG